MRRVRKAPEGGGRSFAPYRGFLNLAPPPPLPPRAQLFSRCRTPTEASWTRRAVARKSRLRDPQPYWYNRILNYEGDFCLMAQVCDVCGRGPQFGNKISHAHNVTRSEERPVGTE